MASLVQGSAQGMTGNHPIDTLSPPLNHNSNAYPISIAPRLFPEIISLIVGLVMDDYFQSQDKSTKHALGGPWVFTQVNKLWRYAVIGTQNLWTRVDIIHSLTEVMFNPVALLNLMMDRSGSMPLSIKFSTLLEGVDICQLEGCTPASPTDIALLKVLIARSSRWKVVDITTDFSVVGIMNSIAGKVDALESVGWCIECPRDIPISDFDIIAFSVAPKLRHLALLGTDTMASTGTVIHLAGVTRYYANMLGLVNHFTNLRALSNLVNCTLSRPGPYNRAGVAHLETIHMRHLTSLKVANATFLGIILAPGLKHLDVSECFDLGTPDSEGLMPVASFVRRSSQALESFRLSHRFRPGASSMTVRQLNTVKLIHIDGMTHGLALLLLMLHCDSIKHPSSLETLEVDIKTLKLGVSGSTHLEGLLKNTGIILHEPTLTHTLLRITFYAPPEDLSKMDDEMLLRGEGKLIPLDEAYCLDLSQNTEWPMIGDGF